MTSGIIAFTKRSNALIPKVRAAILPIVAPPQEVRATVEACQGQEAKSMRQTLVQQPVGCEIAGLPAD
jgi:hypothetical protein